LSTRFEPGAPREIAARLERLMPASRARWDRMDVAQMLCHVTRQFGV